MFEMIENVGAVAGMGWVYALAAAFFAMICESARPKAEEGKHDSLSIPRFLAMVAGTVTPFLLFLHLVGSAALTARASPIAMALQAISGGVWSTGAGAAVVVGLLALVGVIAAASIIGLVIASAAPGLGRALQTPAPFISILVFCFVAYVCWNVAFWTATHPTSVLVVYTN